MPRTFGMLLSVMVGLCAVGCSGNTDGFVYQPVSGTVTLDGEPLADATVVFAPSGSNLESGRPSFGTTDASGRFELQSLGGHNGAVVGDHAVSISTSQVDQNTQEVLAEETLPPNYNARSELSFTVPSSGTDDARFELNSK